MFKQVAVETAETHYSRRQRTASVVECH